MTITDDKLTGALKTHFGFDAFRPHQREIMESLLAGRDVLAVLPTGAGKSLCYQLPAMVRGGLTLVVSPLIALMKDQVDGMRMNGVPAAYLNSSLSAAEMAERTREVNEGKFRLLYVAPERLLAPGFLQAAARWAVSLIAIDEAHCISEWGHDFRPEYRSLARVRDAFPDVPVLALTATATARVRGDIVRQLRLRDPQEIVASFNRPNLTYRVLPKSRGVSQLLAFLNDRPGESGIVYCLARKTCESLAEDLTASGIAAAPYHAGLPPETRGRNQDLFLRDEVRVICATIAFGMGVHKSNVRFVVHFNLPRNIESYYQETGRAGRDGLPSDCLLLFSSGDAGRLGQFIDQKEKESEREVARRQLSAMLAYAESPDCRRRALLGYFGEDFPSDTCEGCDNCLEPRALFDATLPAQKLLSTVFRVREKSGFSTGLRHLVDVVMGKRTPKVEKWGHDQLSVFGVGNEFKANQWLAIGRELLRDGYLRDSGDGFQTLHLTEKAVNALKSRASIRLRTPLTSLKPRKRRGGDEPYDGGLFERLRTLRKSLADERGLPAYMIFSDAALRDMARIRPSTLDEFGLISGVGERKRAEFGPAFLSVLADHAGAAAS